VETNVQCVERIETRMQQKKLLLKNHLCVSVSKKILKEIGIFKKKLEANVQCVERIETRMKQKKLLENNSCTYCILIQDIYKKKNIQKFRNIYKQKH